jgi:hypothetical protein
MTQAACHLILHYSTARLSWKTIKSLRRSQSRLLHSNKHSSSSKDTVRIHNTDDVVSQQVEFEILQGWTILALHSLFVSTGFEYAVRFIIPFYYHLKMLMLIAFTVPMWAIVRRSNSENDSAYGLSPLIPFCFNNIIVPGVHKVHELMDNDPRGWLLYAMAVTPLLILDYVFLPGVLLTEEERKKVRNARRVETKKSTNTPPRRAFPPPPPPISAKATTSKVLSSAPELPRENATEEITSNIQSKVETSCELPSAKVTRPETPPRREKASEESSSSPSCSTPKGFSFTQTPLSPFLNKSGKKSLNLSGFSPLAKSRITSSALRLRQFSRDHNVLSSMKPRSKSKEYENLGGDESLTLPNIRRRNKVSDDIFAASSGPTTPAKLSEPMDIELSDIENEEDDDEATPKPKLQRRKNNRERQRLSFGDHFREMVTGDASIRVRDHLFDLELPSVPSPSPRRHRGGNSSEGNSNKKGLALSPNITTRRRSSRLAKRKGSQQ